MKCLNTEDYTAEDFARFAQMRAILEAHAVPTRVMVESGPDTTGGPVSRYDGTPWMRADAPWPVDSSGSPMIFVAQINTQDADPALGLPDGVLAVFISIDEPEGRALFTPAGEGVDREPDADTSPAMRIRFVEKTDHPNLYDVVPDDLLDADEGACEGALINDTIRCAIDDETGEQISEASAVLSDTIKTRVQNFDGDKVGGHPAWEQDNEAPAGETFVMQISWNGRINEQGDEVDTDVFGIFFVFFNPATADFSVIFQCD